MDVQKAKIAKVNAEEKILRIIENLENETNTKVSDVHYTLEWVNVVMGQSARYVKKVKITLEI